MAEESTDQPTNDEANDAGTTLLTADVDTETSESTGEDAGTETPDEGSSDGEQATETDEAATDEPEVRAPETYELEGVEGDELEQFTEFARKHDLTNDQAQAVLGQHEEIATQTRETMLQEADETRQSWEETVKADPEIGGAQMEKSLANAKLALEHFGSPELITALNDSMLGSHPEVVRMMGKIGRVMKEGKIEGVETPAQGRKLTTEEKMFPSMFPQN